MLVATGIVRIGVACQGSVICVGVEVDVRLAEDSEVDGRKVTFMHMAAADHSEVYGNKQREKYDAPGGHVEYGGKDAGGVCHACCLLYGRW